MECQPDFVVQRQILDVEADLDNCALKCSTTLSIASTEALRVVRLHCRQCKVATVAVNGVNAVFTYSADTLACVVQDVDAPNGAGAGAGEPIAARQRYRDLELYALNHRGESALAGAGELQIQVPPALLSGGPSSRLTVTITYSLANPTGGARFIPVSPWREGMPKHYLIAGGSRHACEAGTFLGGSSGPRTWFPCLDLLHTGCRFVLNVTAFSEHCADCTVVAAGDLQSQSLDALTGRRKFTFVVDTPVAASCISIVAGRLICLSGGTYQYKGPSADAKPATAHASGGGHASAATDLHNESDWGVEETAHEAERAVPPHSVFVTHFAPPGFEAELAHTTIDTGDCKGAIRFMEDYLQCAFPFGSYKQVFIPGAPSDCVPFAAGAVFSTNVLHSGRVIEPASECRRMQAAAVASSWMGIAVGLIEWADLWLHIGLSGFLASKLILHAAGQDDTEEKHRCHQSMGVIAALEQSSPGPLPLAPRDALRADVLAMAPQWHKLLQLKAPLVCASLERIVTPRFMQKALQSIVATAMTLVSAHGGGADSPLPPPTLMRAVSDATTSDQLAVPGRLSTREFIEHLRVMGGAHAHKLQDPYIDRWIHGTGIPLLRCVFTYERRTNEARVTVEQIPPESAYYGKLEFMIHERDFSRLYEEDMKGHRGEFKFPSWRSGRVRKARRGHKPSSGTGAGAGDAVNDLNGAKTSVNDTPFLFVRVDPNFMWMRRVEVVQQEVMWKSQLELSDVVGKLEALHALSALPAPRLPPSTTAAALILECLRDTSQRHGFRVRSAAAMALARWQNLHPPRLTPSPVDAVGGPVYESWEGLKWLIHVYKKLFCDPRSGLPRVLRFKTRVEYELRKVLATAIASIRDADGVTPLEVLEFCVDALQGHDNSGNAFDDGPMVAELVRGLGGAMYDTDMERTVATDRNEADDDEASEADDDDAAKGDNDDDDDDGESEDLFADLGDDDDDDGDDDNGDTAKKDTKQSPVELDPFAGERSDDDDDDDDDDDELGDGPTTPANPVTSPMNTDDDDIGSLELDSDAEEEVLSDSAESDGDTPAGSPVDAKPVYRGPVAPQLASESDSDDWSIADLDDDGAVPVASRAVAAPTSQGAGTGAGAGAGVGVGAGTGAGAGAATADAGATAAAVPTVSSQPRRLVRAMGLGLARRSARERQARVVFEQAWRQLRRAMALETVSEDGHGIITVEVLTALARLEGARKVPLRTEFHKFARAPFAACVRCAALLAILQAHCMPGPFNLKAIAAADFQREYTTKIEPELHRRLTPPPTPQWMPASGAGDSPLGGNDSPLGGRDSDGDLDLLRGSDIDGSADTPAQFLAHEADLPFRPMSSLVASDDQAVHWVATLQWVVASALADVDMNVTRTVLTSLLQTHVSSRPVMTDPHPSLLAPGAAPPLPQRTLRRLGAWAVAPPKGGYLCPLASVDLLRSLPSPRFDEQASRLVETLWLAVNRGSAFNWELRRIAYHLYHSVWGLRPPPLQHLQLTPRSLAMCYGELLELHWLREQATAVIDADAYRVKFSHKVFCKYNDEDGTYSAQTAVARVRLRTKRHYSDAGAGAGAGASASNGGSSVVHKPRVFVGKKRPIIRFSR